jgi:hypothetical protein
MRIAHRRQGREHRPPAVLSIFLSTRSRPERARYRSRIRQAFRAPACVCGALGKLVRQRPSRLGGDGRPAACRPAASSMLFSALHLPVIHQGVGAMFRRYSCSVCAGCWALAIRRQIRAARWAHSSHAHSRGSDGWPAQRLRIASALLVRCSIEMSIGGVHQLAIGFAPSVSMKLLHKNRLSDSLFIRRRALCFPSHFAWLLVLAQAHKARVPEIAV